MSSRHSAERLLQKNLPHLPSIVVAHLALALLRISSASTLHLNVVKSPKTRLHH